MRDPFVFDPSRIAWDYCHRKLACVQTGSYKTPSGLISTKTEEPGREGERVITKRLQSRFARVVAGLSPDQRLAWMAAAQREEAADA